MAVAGMGEVKPLLEADYIALESSSGSEGDLFCGVPDAEECASPGFLRALAADMRVKRNEVGAPPPTPPPASSSKLVFEVDGFDCRVGERPRRAGAGTSCAHLNRLVKGRRSPGQASGAGDKRKRKAQGQADGRPSKLKPGQGTALVRLGGGTGTPQPGDRRLPGDRYPMKWPPGWEMRVAERTAAATKAATVGPGGKPVAGASKDVRKHYYSPSGVHFNSFTKLQQRCADLGLPAEPKAGGPEPRERFEESAAGLRRWLAFAGTLGRLPPQPLLQCAAMRARTRMFKPESYPQF